MNIITALVLILAFILMYMFIIEFFTVAFRATGLSREKARFQVISLFTNSGFTTTESELISSNLARRKLAKCLMIIGHVFSVLVVSLGVAIFGTVKIEELAEEYVVTLATLGSFLLFVILFKLPFVSRPLLGYLDRVATECEVKKKQENIITELDTIGKSSLVEIYVYKLPKVLVDTSIKNANLKKHYNINIIAIKRKNKVVEVNANTILQTFDRIIVYGNMEMINNLFKNHEDVAEKIANARLNKISIIDNYAKDALCEIEVNSLPGVLKDKTLVSSGLRNDYNLTVMMIERNHNPAVINKNTIVEEGDTVLIFGPYDNIKFLFNPEEK